MQHRTLHIYFQPAIETKADEIGAAVLYLVANSGLVRIDPDQAGTLVWSANAVEQIGAEVMKVLNGGSGSTV